MNSRLLLLHLLLTVLVYLSFGCTNESSKPRVDLDSITRLPDTIGIDDTVSHHFIIDSAAEARWNEFMRVQNLLEFHTRDTMNTDSTYIATLSMGKDISSFELDAKLKSIKEPGGTVKVRDTTQEVGLRMSATLEDKAPQSNPNFSISLVGGDSKIRTYDPKKNKMVWQWNVSPLKEGNHQLLLSISQVDENGITIGSPETRHHSITIFSSGRKGGIGKSIAGFLEKYWQWLLGAIALPIFIAWFTTRRRNQKHESPATKRPSSDWKRKRRK